MKGFVFSMDAMIASSLLLIIVLLLINYPPVYNPEETIHKTGYSVARNVKNILSEAKLSYFSKEEGMEDLLSTCNISDEEREKTVIEVIGYLWSENSTCAPLITGKVLELLLNGTNFGYEVLMNGESIYKKGMESAIISKIGTIVSGYGRESTVDGYVAKVHLTTVKKDIYDFVYFGGYEGDGNITKIVELPEDAEVKEVYLELNAGNNFTLYINGKGAGNFSVSPNESIQNLTARKFTVCNNSFNPNVCGYLLPGNNTITVNFTENENMWVGGGYLRLRYVTSLLTSDRFIYENNTKTRVIKLPGIRGIINIYSSFYVPGNLTNISARIHYNTNFPVFLNVGGETIFEKNDTGENIIMLDDNNFTFFNYSSLSFNTVIFRLGTRNLTHITTYGNGTGDSILVTDVSGSMDDCALCPPCTCNYWCVIGGSKSCDILNLEDCTDNVCGGICWFALGHYVSCPSNHTKISLAKNADKEYINITLSVQGNRVGTVSYSNDIDSTLNLTNNKTSLFEEIDDYTAGGATCICCGINKAADMIAQQSSIGRRKAIVVMSDGEANVQCPQQGTGSAKLDTIQAGCDAYNNYNITVYTVGFGEDADEDTLNKTAQCGHGKYYYANASTIAETFKEIASEFINLSYEAQSVVTEFINMNNTLFPDSFISITYVPETKPLSYGELTMSFESKRFGDLTGNETVDDNETKTKLGWFTIPTGTQPLEAMVTSYSGYYWSDRLYVNSSKTGNFTSVFKLSNFSADYSLLGDPFIINIPANLLSDGENISVKIGTGISEENAFGGSPDDRVIYTFSVKGLALSAYSGIFEKANGCNVTVYWDMNGDNSYDGSAFVSVGSSPDGFDPESDAVDYALLKLLDSLNFIADLNEGGTGNGSASNPYDGINQTNPIDLPISENVELTTNYISSVQSMWGPASLEIKIWVE